MVRISKSVCDGVTQLVFVNFADGSFAAHDEQPIANMNGASSAEDILQESNALPQRSRRKRDKNLDQTSVSEIHFAISNESPLIATYKKVEIEESDNQSRTVDSITFESSNGAQESFPNTQPPTRKMRDKTMDSYASMAAQPGARSNGNQIPKALSTEIPNGTKISGRANNNRISSLGDGKFSSAAIPRDHRKYHPQGWVQAEFSDRQLNSDRTRTKEDIRNLERAWQLRIDLDEHKADELEKKLIACQETVGAFAANMSITSRELRQNFQLLEPLKAMSQEAFETKERCSSELKKLLEDSASRARGDTFEDYKSLANNADVRRLRSGADVDQYVNRIESELETSLAGSDARFLMLKDKPNISAGGLRKVTNDSSALLRAEKDAIRKVQELKKVAPALEKRYEDRVVSGQQRQKLEHEREQAQEKLRAIAMERQKIRDRISELKQIEDKQRREFEELDKERNSLRNQISNLKLEIRAELAERNKQRERYRFVLAQEEELMLRHKLRQDEIAGADEAELQNQLEAVENARMAKEEAEAHARMLQSTIARFERLKAEVEGFLPQVPSSNEFGNTAAGGWQAFGSANETSSSDFLEFDKSAISEVFANTESTIKSNANLSLDPASVSNECYNDVTLWNVAGANEKISENGGFGHKVYAQSGAKIRDIGNATPLSLPTVEEADPFNEIDGADNEECYRTLYNAQIYTPSMGDRVREERQTNSEYLEQDESSPQKTAIPVFKALNFNSSAAPQAVFSKSAPDDEVPLAPEFQEELLATMNRLFEIKAQEEKQKPKYDVPKVVKQKSTKVIQEDSDDSQDESVAPLGKMDPVFEAYQKQLSQEINVAEIREKERRQREMRAARRVQTAASLESQKKITAESTKSKGILATIFTPVSVVSSTEERTEVETQGQIPVKEKSRATKTVASKRGKKKLKGSKRVGADSDDDGGSDYDEPVSTVQADAVRLALAKVKRKEADRRFWRTVAFYAALAVLGAIFMYALYESMSEPAGDRARQMSPARRSRMMSSGAYQNQEAPEQPEAVGESEEEETAGARGNREPLIQLPIVDQNQKPFPQPLNVYHGLGDPEGIRRDVRAFVRKFRLMPGAEDQLYRSATEQLQMRVRSQMPTGMPPREHQESDVDDAEDSEDSTGGEDEEEASDPEAEHESDDEESRDEWYEDEDEDDGPSRRERSKGPDPVPVPESPAAASTSRGWQRADPGGSGDASKRSQPAAPKAMHMPRPTGAFGRPPGQPEVKTSGAEKAKEAPKPELELKIKAANGNYLPAFPVFADSTIDSLKQQVPLALLH